MQWKLPGSVSAFVQRAGHAARAQNHAGLAVLLVEQSAYGVDIGEDMREAEATAKGLPRQQKTQKKKRSKGKTTQATGQPKTNTKEEAKARKQAAKARGSK